MALLDYLTKMTQGGLLDPNAMPGTSWRTNPVITQFGASMLGGGGMADFANKLPAAQLVSGAQAEKARRAAAWNVALKAINAGQPIPPEVASVLPEVGGALVERSLASPKTTPLYDNLVAAGLNPGTPEFQKAMLAGALPKASGTHLSVDPVTGAVTFDEGPGVGEIPAGNTPLTAGAKTDLEKDIASGEGQVATVKKIGEEYADKYLTRWGKAEAAVATEADRWGVAGDKDKELIAGKQKFMNDVNGVFNQYRKDITGAAASVQEIERLKDAMINVDLSPTQFKAALSNYADALERGLTVKKQLLKEGITPGVPGFGAKFDSMFRNLTPAVTESDWKDAGDGYKVRPVGP